MPAQLWVPSPLPYGPGKQEQTSQMTWILASVVSPSSGGRRWALATTRQLGVLRRGKSLAGTALPAPLLMEMIRGETAAFTSGSG